MSNKEELNEEELEKISGGKGKNKSLLGKTIYKCDFCGEEFDKRKDIDKHIKALHANLQR